MNTEMPEVYRKKALQIVEGSVEPPTPETEKLVKRIHSIKERGDAAVAKGKGLTEEAGQLQAYATQCQGAVNAYMDDLTDLVEALAKKKVSDDERRKRILDDDT